MYWYSCNITDASNTWHASCSGCGDVLIAYRAHICLVLSNLCNQLAPAERDLMYRLQCHAVMEAGHGLTCRQAGEQTVQSTLDSVRWPSAAEHRSVVLAKAATYIQSVYTLIAAVYLGMLPKTSLPPARCAICRLPCDSTLSIVSVAVAP